ncbi:M42 family metallopeptidase [Metabacillus idriensis]|nr:M42 family metallopeptidase [Metabacillus idriensis]MCM3595502.1 M42 family metallopeptidase [Metabacillus idriensis]
MEGCIVEKDLQLLKQLTETAGPSGFEARIHKVLEENISQITPEIIKDHLGSIVGITGKKGPKILIAGHMDEVGLMVKAITNDGFLKFQTLGGWWGHVMLAQRVKVLTKNGDLTGVIGSKAPHVLSIEERKNVLKPENMFIDIGASSKEEAESFGVQVGDPIATVCPFEVLPNPKFLLARNWDNRAGCYVALKTLEKVAADKKSSNVLYAGATVQEEVGLRGAQTLVNKVNPDISFALDVGVAGDTPGMKEKEGHTELGKGPLLGFFDASMIPHPKLRDFVVGVAKELSIPYQVDIMPGGGTDGGKFHLGYQGVPTLVVSVPARYIHSHVSIVHKDDLDHSVELLYQVIKRLDEKTLKLITEMNGEIH